MAAGRRRIDFNAHACLLLQNANEYLLWSPFAAPTIVVAMDQLDYSISIYTRGKDYQVCT